MPVVMLRLRIFVRGAAIISALSLKNFALRPSSLEALSIASADNCFCTKTADMVGILKVVSDASLVLMYEFSFSLEYTDSQDAFLYFSKIETKQKSLKESAICPGSKIGSLLASIIT